MTAFYPVFLDLRGRRAVVIGGGAVAEQKVRGLIAAGAHVTLGSPETVPPLSGLARRGAVEIRRRPYRPRSGERRVGEEGRFPGGADHLKKKEERAVGGRGQKTIDLSTHPEHARAGQGLHGGERLDRYGEAGYQMARVDCEVEARGRSRRRA